MSLAVGARQARAQVPAPPPPEGRGEPSEPPIALDVDRCVSVDPARLAELLALELRVWTDAGLPAPRGPTKVRIDCDGGTFVVSVDDASGAVPSVHRLDWDWASYPKGSRARLLALSLSETIARRWRQRRAGPPDVAVAPVVVEAKPAVEAPPAGGAAPEASNARPLELGLLASGERIGRPAALGAGLDASLSWPARRWLTLVGAGRAASASLDSAPGSVSARRLSILLAALVGVTRERRLWVGGGPGLRGGWAWLRGEPNGGATASASGRAFDAAWWGPVVVGAASLRLTPHLLIVAVLEAGWFVRPVVGVVAESPPAPAPAETVALDRLWISAATGLAWRF